MRPLNSLENTLIYLVLAIAIAGILYAGFLVRQILRESKGSAKMQQVWGYIRTGANAYLSSQFRIIAILIGILVVVLFFSVYVVNPTPYAIEHFCPDVADSARATRSTRRHSRADVAARNANLVESSGRRSARRSTDAAAGKRGRLRRRSRDCPTAGRVRRWLRQRAHQHRARSRGGVPARRSLLGVGWLRRHEHGGAGQRARRGGGGRPETRLRRCAAHRLPLRHDHRDADRRLRLARRHRDLHHLRHRRAGCPARLRLRRHADRAVHARGRRHLHQSGRRGR